MIGPASGSWASSPAVRRVMQGNRSRDTAPEKAIRSALHALGFRYRVSARPIPNLPRTSDIVFRRARVAVFIDGCYWHGCPEHYTEPSANRAYWTEKILRNKQRDQDTNQRLRDAGWTPVRIWEHESVDDAVVRIIEAVESGLSRPSSDGLGPPRA